MGEHAQVRGQGLVLLYVFGKISTKRRMKTEGEREKERERAMYKICVCGNVARKTIAKSSFPRHVAGECLPREILLMCLHTHTHIYAHIYTHTKADRSSHAALKMQKPKSKNKAKSNAFAINSQ